MCMDNKNNVSTSVSVGEKANYDKLFPKEITPQSNTSQLSIDPKYMSDRVDLTGIKDPAVGKERGRGIKIEAGGFGQRMIF